MPSDWIVGPKPRLLSSAQIVKIEAITAARFGLNLLPFAELTRKTWYPVFRHIYSDVEKHGKSGRGDTFNGIYGLNCRIPIRSFLSQAKACGYNKSSKASLNLPTAG